MPALSKAAYACSPLRADAAPDRPPARAGQSDSGQGRRAEPDQALHLHHQGEPHLRPGLRRHSARATAIRRSASFPSESRPIITPWPGSSCCWTISTSTARSAPTATNGAWPPMPPITSKRSGRWTIGTAGEHGKEPLAGSSIRREGVDADRLAVERLPLGPLPRGGGQLSQLRRVHRERHDARTDPGRARRSRRLEGHFDPLVPRLRPGV